MDRFYPAKSQEAGSVSLELALKFGLPICHNLSFCGGLVVVAWEGRVLDFVIFDALPDSCLKI